MQILMVLFGEGGYPPDVRVAKEAAALTARGHRVTVLTDRAAGGQPDRERLRDGSEVCRIDPPELHGPARLLAKFTLRVPAYTEALDAFLTQQRVDVLHVHNFKYIPTVLPVARRHGRPVIADLHENMPAALAAYRSAWGPLRRARHRVLNNEQLWRRHEAHYLPQCLRVIVVVADATARLLRYRIPSDRIVVVSNTEDETTFDVTTAAPDEAIMSRYAPDWVLSYIGAIGPHRGLDTVLRALPRIVQERPDARLVVVGAQPGQIPELQRRARALGVGERVDVIGWQSPERVQSYIRASRLCLVPHNRSEHTETTLPHKLFQYMICARPVLVSDCRPLARVVDAAGAGWVFRAGDADDLAARVREAWTDPEEAERRGGRGRSAALGPFAWRHDAARLVAMYDELQSEQHGHGMPRRRSERAG